jgi:hypothetical protein
MRSGESCKKTRTLCLDLLEFIEIVKMSVDQWFIGQGPQVLEPAVTLENREAGSADEVRAGTVSARLLCHAARSSTSTMCFCLLAPTAWAKCCKAKVKISVVTLGRSNQWVCRSGRMDKRIDVEPTFSDAARPQLDAAHRRPRPDEEWV